MIKTEEMKINEKTFVKTYSDAGVMIERDGARYSEAIDPAEFDRKYTETDEPIEIPEEISEEVTEEDYQDALREMGVEV